MGPLSALLALPLALAAEPRVELLAPRGEPLPGAEVPLWIVTSEGGSPLSGAVIQISADAGALVAQDGEIAPGIWQVRYRAPLAGEQVRFALAAGEARGAAQLRLAAPPMPSLSLPAVVFGTVGQALSVDVEGADPPPASQLGVVASEGRVEGVLDAEGRLRLTWSPGADPFPRAVLLGVRDLRRPGDPPAWTVIQLKGRARVPISTEPGSKVSLRVGGRSYGPFLAGEDGVAAAAIEVRPGEDQAEVLIEDAAGNTQKSTLSLGGAASPTLVVSADPTLAPGEVAPPIYVRAVDAQGAPWRGPEPVCTSSAGPLSAALPTGAGSWRLALPPLPADAFFDVRVECTLRDQARASARIPVDNALPARLVLRTWPDELSGDNPVAQVLVSLENGLGERVAGEGIRLAATHGTVEVEETPGQGSLRGLYDGSGAVAQGADTLRATWERPPGQGLPWDLHISAVAPAPGAPLTVAARALDRRGLPLEGLELEIAVGAARLAGRTDARGWARVELPAPAVWPATLEAGHGALRRRAVLFAGGAVGADPGAPDLVAERALPIRAGRVREVFLAAEPPVLGAGGGETALVVVRLLDRAGQAVTDLVPQLEASAGTLSAPKPRPDGSFEAVFTPPANLPFGVVSVTASGAVGTPAEFRGSTTLEIVPREVTRAPGLELGVLAGAGGQLSSWLSLEFDQRLSGARWPLFARFALGTYAEHAVATDAITGADLDLDLRLFPLSLSLLTRTDGRRGAAWVGAGPVIAPYQLEMRLDDALIVQGPGFAQPGFSIVAGRSWRMRAGEIQTNVRFLALFTGETDVGWQGSVGGVVGTVGYRLLY